MDRFLGRHAKRLDSKGRVSVPAPFRETTAAGGFEGLYCVRSLWNPCIDAGGAGLVDEINRVVDQFPSLTDDHDQVATALLGAGEVLNIDGEGRIVLPGWIKDTIGAEDEIIFVGQGVKFQIWAPASFARFEAEARARAAALFRARSPAGRSATVEGA